MQSKSFCDLPVPALILPSYQGHLPYSPPDLNVRIPNEILAELDVNEQEVLEKPYQLVLMDAFDVAGKDFGHVSVESLSTINKNLIPILSFRSMNGHAVSADSKSISMNTKIGRRKLTLEEYSQRYLIDRPQAVVALADEVNYSSVGNNRLKKAVQRTAAWLQELKATQGLANIIPCIMANYNLKDHVETVWTDLRNSGATAIAIGGLNCGESINDRMQLILNTKNSAEANGFSPLFMIHNCDSFEEILFCLENKVELIHSTYGSILTVHGSALYLETWSEVEREVEPEKSLQEIVGEKRSGYFLEQENASAKKAKIESENFGLGLSCLVKDTDDGIRLDADISPYDQYSINLWNPSFRRDCNPLMQGCKCSTCLFHTRAYIHHLLKSKELLAEILLYQHNQYQLQKLFCSARSKIRSGNITEWLEDLKDAKRKSK